MSTSRHCSGTYVPPNCNISGPTGPSLVLLARSLSPSSFYYSVSCDGRNLAHTYQFVDMSCFCPRATLFCSASLKIFEDWHTRIGIDSFSYSWHNNYYSFKRNTVKSHSREIYLGMLPTNITENFTFAILYTTCFYIQYVLLLFSKVTLKWISSSKLTSILFIECSIFKSNLEQEDLSKLFKNATFKYLQAI